MFRLLGSIRFGGLLCTSDRSLCIFIYNRSIATEVLRKINPADPSYLTLLGSSKNRMWTLLIPVNDAFNSASEKDRLYLTSDSWRGYRNRWLGYPYGQQRNF